MKHIPTGQWIMCFKGDETFSPEKRRAGLHGDSYICIPPPFNDMSFKCGLWNYMNSCYGTIFSQFEEDLLDAQLCLSVSCSIKEFVRAYPPSGDKNLEGEFVYWMELLAAFLQTCNEQLQPAELFL